MSDIVCAGILVADVFGMPIDTIPEKASLQLFDEMEMHPGGCPVNSGIAMSKLGIKTGVIGKVGEDIFGDFIIRELASNGIDTSGIVRTKDSSTSFTFVMVASDGERRFIHTMGANAVFCKDDVNMEVVKQAKILHVAGTGVMPTLDGEQTAEVLQEAKRLGVITSIDTVYNDRLEDFLGAVEPSLPHLDYFLPSIEEAMAITGKKDAKEIAHFLKDKGCGTVGLKLGREGCYLLSDDVEEQIPIYRVETVDSSGAGDCWVAGFLTGISQGWDVVESARFGNATAAFGVQAVGCSTGIKSIKETKQFQEEYQEE